MPGERRNEDVIGGWVLAASNTQCERAFQSLSQLPPLLCSNRSQLGISDGLSEQRSIYVTLFYSCLSSPDQRQLPRFDPCCVRAAWSLVLGAIFEQRVTWTRYRPIHRRLVPSMSICGVSCCHLWTFERTRQSTVVKSLHMQHGSTWHCCGLPRRMSICCVPLSNLSRISSLSFANRPSKV